MTMAGRGGSTRRMSSAYTGGGSSGRFGPGRLGADGFEPVPKERRGRTVRRIVAFFRPYRWQVAVVTVAILATSVLGLVNPILLKLLIDVAIPQKDFALLTLDRKSVA